MTNLNLNEFLTRSIKAKAICETMAVSKFDAYVELSRELGFEYDEDTDLFFRKDKFLNPFALNAEEKKSFFSYQRKIPVLHMLYNFDYFSELELENDDYDKQITLRDAALAWESWKVELVEAFAFPTLAGYWNSPKKRSLKYEVRMYSITEPTFHKKVYLLLIKPDYLGIHVYIPLFVKNANEWKASSFYPIITYKVNFKNPEVAESFGRKTRLFVNYSPIFKCYIASVDSDNRDEFCALPILANPTDRVLTNNPIKKTLFKRWGDVSLNEPQVVLYGALDDSQLKDDPDTDWWYYSTPKMKRKIVIPDYINKLVSMVDQLVPSTVDEIAEYSKPLVEREIVKFPKAIQDNYMQFKNSSPAENHQGIYLLFGKDKKDEWVIKVGRTRNFKQRALLYKHFVKTKNDRFKDGSNVVLLDFLPLDELDALHDNEVDRATYEGAEALFRNYFWNLDEPKYPHEWFRADNAKEQERLINAFRSLKSYIQTHSQDFYDFLHNSSQRHVASYVRARLKNATPEEAISNFAKERVDEND